MQEKSSRRKVEVKIATSTGQLKIINETIRLNAEYINTF